MLNADVSQAYLASESDSEGDAPEQVQDKYRALLRGADARAGGKGWGAADSVR